MPPAPLPPAPDVVIVLVIVPPPTPVVVADAVVLEAVAPVLLTLFVLPATVELAVEAEVVPLLGDVVTADVFDAVVLDAVVFDAAVVLVMVDVLPIVFIEVVGSSASGSDELHCERANGSATKPNGTTSVFRFIAAVSYGGDRAPTSRPLIFLHKSGRVLRLLLRDSRRVAMFELWQRASYPRILCLAIA